MTITEARPIHSQLGPGLVSYLYWECRLRCGHTVYLPREGYLSGRKPHEADCALCELGEEYRERYQ